MGDGQGRQLASKWAKTAVLLANSQIAPHIPPTRIFTKQNLRSMLHSHSMVVIKPVCGAGGHGVIKVAKEGDGYKHRIIQKQAFFVIRCFLSIFEWDAQREALLDSEGDTPCNDK